MGVKSPAPPPSIEGPVVTRPSQALRSKPVAAAALVFAFGLVLQWTPGAERWRLWDRPFEAPREDRGMLNEAEQRVGESELVQETRHRPELAQPDQPSRPPAARGPIARAVNIPEVDVEKAVAVSIVDSQRSLDPFYAALAATAQGEPNAITRILYFGDSIVASDYVTGTLRRALQEEFGDAGHGFVLMADAWPSYFHNDVFRFASRGFQVSRVVGPYLKDGLYGLGGVSFKAPPGVRARFGTVDEGAFGRSVSRFQLLYLEQPYGGKLRISIDGDPHATIDTEAAEPRAAVFEIKVDDGPHLMEVLTAERFTRTFGVVLERDVPGVVLDAIGIQGARIRFLDKQDDAHWAQQLQLRTPNLLVYQFGANESGDGFAYSMEDYHRTMKEVLEQGQRAVPDAGCLIVGAMDRARKEGDALVTVPIIPHIVKEQREVAEAVGCAFFDTYEAMGGRGSMAIWVRRGLGQADMTHPSGWGAQVLGNWLYGALIEGYNAYLEREATPTP